MEGQTHQCVGGEDDDSVEDHTIKMGTNVQESLADYLRTRGTYHGYRSILG